MYLCVNYSLMEANFIKGIVNHHRKNLLLTYTLVLIEKLGELSIPFFLGLSIDGLIKQNFIPILYLVVVYLIWATIGTIRHRYDTKTYTNIYNQVVFDLIGNDKDPNTSKIAAHATLIREVVDFMEFDMVYIATAFINIIGAMAMISTYSIDVVLLCLTLMVPVLYLSKGYGLSMRELSQKKNTELEKQVDVISNGNILETKHHFNILRIIQIRISNKEATNYWQLQLVSLVLLIGSLLIMGFKGAVQAGALVAMWSYLLTFLNGLEIIPYSIQRWSNLKDIINRIRK